MKFQIFAGASVVLLGAVFSSLFQNCAPTFKAEDYSGFHGNGGLNSPGSGDQDWGMVPVVSNDPKKGNASPPTAENYAGGVMSGDLLFIPNTTLSSTGIKFEVRPVGVVQGSFMEDTRVNSNGGSVAGIAYRSPLHFSGTETFEFVAVDEAGFKSTKGKIVLQVERHPMTVRVDEATILNSTDAHSLGVTTKDEDRLHSVNIGNAGEDVLTVTSVSCSDPGYAIVMGSKDKYPHQLQQRSLFTVFIKFNFQAQNGVVEGRCVANGSYKGISVSRRFLLRTFVVSNLTKPNFSPMSIKVNLISLKHPKTGAVAGDKKMLDRILSLLARDFVLNGVKPVQFLKGSYKVVVSEHYNLQGAGKSLGVLNSQRVPREITYIMGSTFNTNALGEAYMNASLQRGILIGITVTGVQAYDGVVSHELGHAFNLQHTAHGSAQTIFGLSQGELDFCRFSAASARYPVYDRRVRPIPPAVLNNIMFESGSLSTRQIFTTGNYGGPMLNIVNCWKAINRITF